MLVSLNSASSCCDALSTGVHNGLLQTLLHSAHSQTASSPHLVLRLCYALHDADSTAQASSPAAALPPQLGIMQHMADHTPAGATETA